VPEFKPGLTTPGDPVAVAHRSAKVLCMVSDTVTTAILTQKDHERIMPAAAGDGKQPAGHAWIDGSWLDRRRLAIGAALLLAFELGIFAFLVAGTHGWIVPLDRPTTTDFISFYAAGALANADTPALAYDHAAHLAAEELVVGAGIGYQYFNYPPVFMLLCTALAALPYLVAFVLFEAATLLLYLFVARHILADRSATALIVLLAFPIVFWNFGLGQNAFLTAALFGAATLLVDRRPVIAGLLFGALCYKPQFGLMIPLALAAAGQWRAFAAAGASAAALVLASLAVFGVDTWRAFIETVTASPAMYQSGRILFAGMANVFGGARVLGADTTLAYALQAVATVSAGVIVVAAWRCRLSLPTRAAVLAAATVVAAPLVLLYDLMLASVAAVWLVRDRNSPAASGWEMVLLAVIYLVLLDGRMLAEEWHVPAFPLAAVGVLAIAASRAWRELALNRAAASPASVLARSPG
jgi:alpha-1,2-mannosyltransferase